MYQHKAQFKLIDCLFIIYLYVCQLTGLEKHD